MCDVATENIMQAWHLDDIALFVVDAIEYVP
jgi:hypothetical protein